MIRAEVDRKHLGDEHLQRRQRTRTGRERKLPAATPEAREPDWRERSPPRAFCRPSGCPAYVFECLPDAIEFRLHKGHLFGRRRKPPGRSTADSWARGWRRCGISHQRIGNPSDSTRWAMAEKSSQVAPTLHVSSPGNGKRSPLTKAPSMARTGQKESSMPSESAISSKPDPPSNTQGSHHAPSG